MIPLPRRIWHLAQLLLLLIVVASLAAARWPLTRQFKGRPLDPVVLGDEAEAFDHDGDGIPDDFSQVPLPVLQRTVTVLSVIQRGDIYDRQGNVLAVNCLPAEGSQTRCYSDPSLSHTVGYVTTLGLDFVGPGVRGLEKAYNDTLLGLDRLDSQLGRVVHRPIIGSHIYLTIDSPLQQAAAAALTGRAGAIVVLDADSGAVLAMVSGPSFDPNRLLNEGNYLGTLDEACGGAWYCQDPLFNRATHGSYPPGSTWKTVTAIAALESGMAKPTDRFYFGLPQEEFGGCYAYRLDGPAIRDCNPPSNELDFVDSYAYSANSTFAQLGDLMSGETLVDYAGRFGIGTQETLPLEIGSLEAQLANDPAALNSSRYLRACTSIGQCQLTVSPLHMGLIVAAVVNGGDVPTPHLVQEIRYPSGDGRTITPDTWHKNVIKEQTAEQVRQMMLATVEYGTAVAANPAIPGFLVGGKTGTAETGYTDPHAWFTGFVQDEASGRAVVIVVVIEYGGEGAVTAVPAFAAVAPAAAAYLSSE